MHMSLDVSQFLVMDALIVAGVVVASFLFTYTVGKYSIVPAIAALGMAAACATIVPFVGHVPVMNVWPAYQQQALAFAIFLLLSYFIFRRHSYFEPSVIPSRIELAVCSVMIAGFILAVIGSFLPVDVVATLSPHVRTIFVGELPRTLWLLSPVVVFGVMKGR